MAVVKNLMVRSGADFSALYKETKKAQQQLAGFQKNISTTMKAIGAVLATVGLGALVKDSVKVAMQYEASVQQIGRIMGNNAVEFQKWASANAAAFGMAKAEAMKYGAVYGNLISGFTKSTGETMAYTQDLLKASAIVAAATGRTMEDTMERIRSGLLGNTESIEDLGINVNVAMIESTKAFQKFAGNKSWQQLGFQTQQQIRLMAILEQATKKYGDNITNNTAYQQMMFVAQLKNAQLALGQAFLPIYNAVLPALTAMASALARTIGVIAQFMQAIFGKPAGVSAQTKAANEQAAAVSGVGDAYKKTGKEAKKAQGSVAGFDEINSLADNTAGGGASGASGGGGGAAGIVPETEGDAGGISGAIDDISPKIQAMANKVRQAFKDLADFLKENKDYVISALAGIVSAFAGFAIITNWSAIVSGLSAAFTGLGAGIAAISWPVIAVAAAIGLFIANLVYLWRTNDKFRESVIEVWTKIKTFVTKVAEDMWSIVKGIWDKYGQTLINNLLGFLGTIQSAIVKVWDGFIKPFITKALEVLTELWDYHLKGLVEQIGIFVMKLVNAALEIWNEFIAPIMGWLIDNFGPVFAKVFGDIFEVIGGLLGIAADVATGLFEALGGIVDFISGVFTGDWKKAWEGVKSIFKGVFDSLYTIVKVPLNLIIAAINEVIMGLNKISFDLPSWVPGVGGKSFGINIKPIPPLAKGGITNGPMMAMIGDNPGGREVVSPLDDLKDIVASAVGTAIMAANQFNGGNSKQGDVIIQLDGTTLARVLNPYSNKEKSRIGGSMITTA